MRPLKSIDEDVARLRDFIGSIESAGDTRLPPEPKLSEQLGVSRSRLRTMLKRLEDEGIIWRHVGKGTFVGPRQPMIDNSNLATSISANDYFEARLLLEPEFAAQAAIHATETDIQVLENCALEMAEAKTFHQWRRGDEKLHRTVAEATHNALLLLMYDTLRSHLKLGGLGARMEEVFGAPSAPRNSTNSEHEAIVEAIRSRSPERAKHAMREHIGLVRSTLFGMR